MWRTKASKAFAQELHMITGAAPYNLALYRLALQHKSCHAAGSSNERLEFLGDAVLSMVVAEFLFSKYPHEQEGFMTELRSRIVNRDSLGKLAHKIGVDTMLGQRNRLSTQRGLKFVYGNALEALVGALYLDRGYPHCAYFITQRLIKAHLDLQRLSSQDTNYKSQLLTWAQRTRCEVRFVVEGQRHAFVARAMQSGTVLGTGQGTNKKQAEQHAAQSALVSLQRTAPKNSD